MSFYRLRIDDTKYPTLQIYCFYTIERIKKTTILLKWDEITAIVVHY